MRGLETTVSGESKGGANMARKKERGNGDGDVWPRKN